MLQLSSSSMDQIAMRTPWHQNKWMTKSWSLLLPIFYYFKSFQKWHLCTVSLLVYELTVRMALIQPYRYRPCHQIWLFLLQTSNLVPKRGSRWFLTSSTTHCHMSVFTAFLAHFPIFGLFSLKNSTFLDPKVMDIYK